VKFTLLHHVAEAGDPFNFLLRIFSSSLRNSLVTRSFNVNVIVPQCETVLLRACFSGSVTSLDFVELLLRKNADPNTQDCFREEDSIDDFTHMLPVQPNFCRLAYHSLPSITDVLPDMG
jgi:ankyrin repeat protein